jgi:putative FmdB family regulatory protein
MPIYEYECEKCKKRFEHMQSMSEPKKTVCEECGGALERVISPSGFVLKGGGWYKDLYSSTKKPDSSGDK